MFVRLYWSILYCTVLYNLFVGLWMADPTRQAGSQGNRILTHLHYYSVVLCRGAWLYAGGVGWLGWRLHGGHEFGGSGVVQMGIDAWKCRVGEDGYEDVQYNTVHYSSAYGRLHQGTWEVAVWTRGAARRVRGAGCWVAYCLL